MRGTKKESLSSSYSFPAHIQKFYHLIDHKITGIELGLDQIGHGWSSTVFLLVDILYTQHSSKVSSCFDFK